MFMPSPLLLGDKSCQHQRMIASLFASLMLTFEMGLRFGLALLLFMALAWWEWRAPRRARLLSRLRRWPNNLGVVTLDVALVWIGMPAFLIGAALIGQGQGLFALAGFPLWLAGLLGIIVLDGAIYAQHVMFHKVPVLWRLHRMHHSDLDLDVTTGLRFHPIEILISLIIKAGVILAFGIPFWAVLVFEVILNAMAMFNHTNAGIPAAFEPWLRAFVVTPQMHEVHHSMIRSDIDSNFGFNLSVWDRLFRTYRAMPTSALKGEAVTIGTPNFRTPNEARIDRLLTQPFRDA